MFTGYRRCTAAAIVGALLLQGCAENGAMNGNGSAGGLFPQGTFSKANIGTLAGAAGGAWVGSNVGKGKGKIVSIAAGTLLGAALGRSVGASLDRADMEYYSRSSQSSMENTRTGETTSWQNPDNGHSGSFTPTRTYQTAEGYCRDYTQTINVSGRAVTGHGTACRQPDGTWRIVNES